MIDDDILSQFLHLCFDICEYFTTRIIPTSCPGMKGSIGQTEGNRIYARSHHSGERRMPHRLEGVCEGSVQQYHTLSLSLSKGRTSFVPPPSFSFPLCALCGESPAGHPNTPKHTPFTLSLSKDRLVQLRCRHALLSSFPLCVLCALCGESPGRPLQHAQKKPRPP